MRHRTTYLELLLRFENLGQFLGGSYSQSVSKKTHFLDLGVVLQGLDVGGDVFGGVELEALSLKGENLGICHGDETIETDSSTLYERAEAAVLGIKDR